MRVSFHWNSCQEDGEMRCRLKKIFNSVTWPSCSVFFVLIAIMARLRCLDTKVSNYSIDGGE